MATVDPTQDTLASLNRLFDRLDKVSQPFNEQGGVLSKAVPFEMNAQNGQIQPAGWVSNADGTAGTATVTIDGDGIEVLDGKITVKDAGGSTTISGGVAEGSGGIYEAGAVTAAEIAAGTITATEIASGAVTSAKFATAAQAPGVLNSTGYVEIDSTGVTITNGALTSPPTAAPR